MTYKDFLNIDEKILIRDKKLFDYINKQIEINQNIYYDPDPDNNHECTIAGAKFEAYSDIYSKLLELSNEQFKPINKQPNQ